MDVTVSYSYRRTLSNRIMRLKTHCLSRSMEAAIGWAKALT